MKLLHLYYDLMNLYGEYANVTVLQHRLEEQGLSVSIERKTLGESFDCAQYDFIYMGAGTESNQKAALKDLLPHREELVSAVQNGAVLLFTGSAFELLGKTIADRSGTEYRGLELFAFTAQETDQRITGDAIFHWERLKTPVVGFINTCAHVSGISQPLFTVSMGPGNQPGAREEGVFQGTVFGTHLTGPVLVKNPFFLDYLATLLGKRQDPGFTLSPRTDSYETRAYEITLRELTKRRDGN